MVAAGEAARADHHHQVERGGGKADDDRGEHQALRQRVGELRRVDALPPSPLPAAPDSSRLIGIEVLELGPVVKLLSSAALVDGWTEVVFRAVRYPIGTADEPHSFIVHWRHGGLGVVDDRGCAL